MATEGTIGEISPYSFNYTPKYWVQCDGQVLTIAQNPKLFSIIGNKFGGDGVTTFALPDLRGRAALHPDSGPGAGIALAQAGGEEKHSLSIGEMPAHNHTAYGSAASANQASPSDHFWASNSGKFPYASTSNAPMAANAIGMTGQGHGHENMSPFLTLNFGICVFGTFKYREGVLGEIILYAGDDLPKDWAPCDGRIVPISFSPRLFSIIGTLYGGDGVTTFGLPNLSGAAPVSSGQGNGLSNYPLGQRGGAAEVNLTKAQMANHNHLAQATTAASQATTPANAIWGRGGEDRGGVPFYTDSAGGTAMNAGALANTGQNQPHNNLPPYLGINFLICVNGPAPPGA